MAYIYKITNDVNQKIYVGKTEFSIEKRFKEHCRDAFQGRNEHRPLYSAMQKYGIEHFHIELLEETDSPEERERHWIEKLGSFKYGYNATLGGDGKPYLDYDLVIATYQVLKSEREVAKCLDIDAGSVRNILRSRDERIYSLQEVNKIKFGRVVNQFSLTGEFIQSFATAKDAARFIRPDSSSIGGVTSHITDVCKGKRRTAYGFIWKFAD